MSLNLDALFIIIIIIINREVTSWHGKFETKVGEVSVENVGMFKVQSVPCVTLMFIFWIVRIANRVCYFWLARMVSVSLLAMLLKQSCFNASFELEFDILRFSSGMQPPRIAREICTSITNTNLQTWFFSTILNREKLYSDSDKAAHTSNTYQENFEF